MTLIASPPWGSFLYFTSYPSFRLSFISYLYILQARLETLKDFCLIHWPYAAVGGFAGSTVAMTIRWGCARGVYSNEAGFGSAPTAHCNSNDRLCEMQTGLSLNGYFDMIPVKAGSPALCVYISTFRMFFQLLR